VADRTIVALSGGITEDAAFGPLLLHGVERTGVAGRAPRVCHVGTAGGDDRWWNAALDEAGQRAGVVMSHLKVFPRLNTERVAEHLVGSDIVYVSGGSVENLLALWRLHSLDTAMRTAWEAGVVLVGTSAGSMCWHVGGTTNTSAGPMRAFTDGLGFIPYSNLVHHDIDPQRRRLFHQLVLQGILPEGYATDEGVGLVYVGTDVVETVAETEGALAYHVRLSDDGERVIEEPIEPRLLPGATRR